MNLKARVESVTCGYRSHAGAVPLWAGHPASQAPASFSLISTGAVITSPLLACVSEDWGNLVWSAGLHASSCHPCGPRPMAGPPPLFPL